MVEDGLDEVLHRYPHHLELGLLAVQLEVTASVGGTEGYNAVLFQLPMSAADMTNQNVPPPSTPRTFGSLSSGPFTYSALNGEQPGDELAGSPFPYQSVTPTCP